MTTNFQNNNWDFNLQTDDVTPLIYVNDAQIVDLEIVIYENTEYDAYITWLRGSGADAIEDDTVVELSASTRNTFIQKAENEYTSWSLHVQMTYNGFSVTNQEAAFCIEEIFINNGILCGGVSSGSGIEATESYTYWLPNTHSELLTGTYDLTQSDNDQYLIDDYYKGLTEWKILYSTPNTFQADKFQLADVSNDAQWIFDIKDFRYLGTDDVNLFSMYESSSHYITWQSITGINLSAVAGIAATALTFASATLLSF